jgi:hypothetical protein
MDANEACEQVNKVRGDLSFLDELGRESRAAAPFAVGARKS